MDEMEHTRTVLQKQLEGELAGNFQDEFHEQLQAQEKVSPRRKW